MMRKPLLFTVCVVVISFMTVGAIAAEKTIVRLITGDVVTLDASINTLTIRGKKAEVVIVTDEKTIIRMDKQKENKALSDVKVGDNVTVKYVDMHDKKIARSIVVKGPTAGKK
jgi:hypothetical protein